jgi:cell shape-determining protein MreC
MSEIVEIIDTLEERLKKLVQKLVILEQKNSELNQELSKSAALFKNQSQQIEELKKQNESLKIAKSLLGSDENKRDTKLKINSLIREIDYCIAQLAD